MIKTTISNTKISFTLDRPLRFCGKTKLTFEYDMDISNTPEHVANYMLGILLSEHFSWNSGTIKFSELTWKELESIRYHVKMNENADPYDRVVGKPIRIITNELVSNDRPKGNGPILVGNGMGKDGLATACIGNELTGNVQPFTVGNQYSNKQIWEERKLAMQGFTEMFNMPSTNFIMTDYLQGVGYKIIPWWIMGLPLMYAYDSDIMIVGSDMAYSKNKKGTRKLLRPNISIFSLGSLSAATGTTISSPTNPLCACGVQKILVDRYPEALPFQRSCMRGMPWCRKCEDCYKTALYMENAESDPELAGVPSSGTYSGKVQNAIMNPMVHDIVYQMRRRNARLSFNDWYLKANEHVFPLIWNGDRIRNIMAEHFQIDKKDPGADGIGYEYLPSKWGQWMKEGMI